MSRLPDSSDLDGTVQQSSVASNLTEKIRECLRQKSTLSEDYHVVSTDEEITNVDGLTPSVAETNDNNKSFLG